MSTILPDGSCFFVATIGERPPGLLNRVKYHRKGYARGWLLLWRNYRSAYEVSRWQGQGPPMSRLQSIRWALLVHPRGHWL